MCRFAPHRTLDAVLAVQRQHKRVECGKSATGKDVRGVRFTGQIGKICAEEELDCIRIGRYANQGV